MDVDLHGDKILVRVAKTDWSHYLTRTNDSAPILHAVVVLPVLVHAISQLEESDFADYVWAVRLKELLARREIDHCDPVRAAQLVLKLPVSRGLRNLNHLLERGQDG